jgi:DNA-binding transcriptional MerR regulator
MPTDYSLADLTKLTGVSPRTVRYYVAQGLLPSPTQQGPSSRYTEAHIDRLRLIKRLQAAHLPLAEIRRQIAALPADQVATLADSAPAYAPTADSALDYIQSLLTPAPRAIAAMPAVAIEPPPQVRSEARSNPRSEPNSEPHRAQWERITLDPDVELHVRRPLTRQQNRRVERLISIARQLLEEE